MRIMLVATLAFVLTGCECTDCEEQTACGALFEECDNCDGYKYVECVQTAQGGDEELCDQALTDDICAPTEHLETCDGTDEDGDGVVDNNLPIHVCMVECSCDYDDPTQDGDYVYPAAGEQTCVNGHWEFTDMARIVLAANFCEPECVSVEEYY